MSSHQHLSVYDDHVCTESSLARLLNYGLGRFQIVYCFCLHKVSMNHFCISLPKIKFQIKQQLDYAGTTVYIVLEQQHTSKIDLEKVDSDLLEKHLLIQSKNVLLTFLIFSSTASCSSGQEVCPPPLTQIYPLFTNRQDVHGHQSLTFCNPYVWTL